MISIETSRSTDRRDVEKLIHEYHVSEGLTPREDRVAWAVDQQLSGSFPGVLLIARDGNTPVGVALAVYTPSAELGRVMTINDFYVRPAIRRKHVGSKMAKRLVDESRLLEVDEINLEVISGDRPAASFWRSLGFEPANRTLFKLKISRGSAGSLRQDSSLRMPKRRNNWMPSHAQKSACRSGRFGRNQMETFL